ncbi:hypothetical protein CLOM_g22946 [Closterium sp. NIES-68]|nr:hypothetical protein CLOM_g22946 [Closterium sp. NIES-68]GJP57511.1 hypothetical protein CLOP_g12221 [Closterium sp. NIES-67]
MAGVAGDYYERHGPIATMTNGEDGHVAMAPRGGSHSFAKAWSSERLSDGEEGWEAELRRREGVEFTRDVKQWLCDRTDFGEAWKWTHITMREALETSQAVQPVRFYLMPSHSCLYSAWSFCRLMVGHPEIVHGGATAFAFDETFGLLFATLNLGPGFTANININYRKPLPADMVACLQASLERREGRKVYLKGSLRSAPDGDIFSEATALFIIPKKQQEQ